MRNKSLLIMLFVLSASVVMAQNDTHKMTDTQKTQDAKADVFIINSKKKITDSFTTTSKDTTGNYQKIKEKILFKAQ